MNGTLFFDATDGVHGYQLWRSNGTAGGTSMVKEINLTANSSPYYLTNVNGTLFFDARDGTAGLGYRGMELWRSNGTAAGTVRLSASLDSSPSQFTNMNGTPFFLADDGGLDGKEIWQSNGTNAGTTSLGGQLFNEGQLVGFGDSYPNDLGQCQRHPLF